MTYYNLIEPKNQWAEVGPRTSLMYVRWKITPEVILMNIDPRKMKLLSLDSSHWDESNKLNFIKIQLVVIEITGVCSLKFLKNTPEISKFLKILYDQ